MKWMSDVMSRDEDGRRTARGVLSQGSLPDHAKATLNGLGNLWWSRVEEGIGSEKPPVCDEKSMEKVRRVSAR